MAGNKIQNPALVRSMIELKDKSVTEKDESVFRGYMENVLRAKFIMPAMLDPKPEVGPDGKVTQNPDTKISFCLLQSPNKEAFFPLFTDEEQYKKGNFPGADRIVIGYKDLVPAVVNAEGNIKGLIINPFDHACIVPYELIRDMDEGVKKAAKEKMEKEKVASNVKKQEIGANTKIALRSPRFLPLDLLDAAKKFFDEKGNVDAAYIQMMEQDGSEDKYLIVLDAEDVDQTYLGELMAIIKPLAYGIDVLLTETNNGLGHKVLELAEPFYEKGKTE